MQHELAVAVTGAAQGIGRAIALRLAQEGASVCVADVNQEKARATADELAGLGGRAIPVRTDVSDTGSVRDMVAKTVAEFGRLDIMVCNAGIIQVKPFFDITAEDWDRTLRINALGTFLSVQASARHMSEQAPMGPGRPHGKIITVASVAGRYGAGSMAPLTPHYRASKAAVISLTQTAAFGLAPKVTVNAVCPGLVDTDMWAQIDREWGIAENIEPGEAWRTRTAAVPLGRPQRPEDVADAVSFLASAKSDYMTGQSINVDGGLFMS